MLLLVTHYSKNMGVTDFFVEFLEKKENDFYLLKHPFTYTNIKFSELYLYSDGKYSLIKKYKKINNEIINLVIDFFVSIRVSLLLGKRVNKIISFGSFNVIPFIFLKKFFKRNLFFYGVDYSRKRFSNVFLNKLYIFFETLSCKYCSVVISVSKRQEDARIKFHNLKKTKSIVATNGIELININKDFSKFNELAFLYIGSMNEEHGITSFINYLYIKNIFPYVFYIIGAGKETEIIQRIIKNNNLENKIFYLGYKNQKEIISFLLEQNRRLFGVAPYSDKLTDCVHYGDSLKIKEYLNFNLPYITSNVVYIPEELRKFGIVYDSLSEFFESLENKLQNFNFSIKEKNETLARYKWEYTFRKVAKLI